MRLASLPSNIHPDSHPRPRRSRLLVGGLGLLSLALGLLLAIVAFGIVVLYKDVVSFDEISTRGGYCSKKGIGRYPSQTAEQKVIYIDDGWGDVPPAQHCRVYLVEKADANPRLSIEEEPRSDTSSHELLAAGSYPGTSEYAVIVGVLLLPPAIWALWALLEITGRPRRPVTPH